MWSAVKDVLKQYAGSKKAIAAAVAGLVWAGGKFGLHIDNAELLGAVSPLWLYVVALALEDHGKAAKKLEAPRS